MRRSNSLGTRFPVELQWPPFAFGTGLSPLDGFYLDPDKIRGNLGATDEFGLTLDDKGGTDLYTGIFDSNGQATTPGNGQATTPGNGQATTPGNGQATTPGFDWSKFGQQLATAAIGVGVSLTQAEIQKMNADAASQMKLAMSAQGIPASQQSPQQIALWASQNPAQASQAGGYAAQQAGFTSAQIAAAQ